MSRHEYSANMNIPVNCESTQWDWPLSSGDGIVQITDDDRHFQVALEAQYFTPKDIEVKAIGDVLEIHLEHTEKPDVHGRVTRNITRCYKLPSNVDKKSIKSKLDDRGFLHISGDKQMIN